MARKNIFVLGLLLSSQLTSATNDTPPTPLETAKTKISALASKVATLLKKPMAIPALVAITAIGTLLFKKSRQNALQRKLLLSLQQGDDEDRVDFQGERFNSAQEATQVLEKAVKDNCSPQRADFLINNGAKVSQGCLKAAIENARESEWGLPLFTALCDEVQITKIGEQGDAQSIKASDLLEHTLGLLEHTPGPIENTEDQTPARAHLVAIHDYIHKKYGEPAKTGSK